MTVVPILCNDKGYIDMDDVKTKLTKHSKEVAAFMITYPSTFGVFESTVKELCDLVHEHGG